MKIKNENLNDDLVMEMGRFAILWNCFERNHCNFHSTPSQIKEIAPRLNIDEEKQSKLAEVLNQRRMWFGQLVSEYVEASLHPDNAHNSSADNKKRMEEFVEQRGDLRCGCLLVIHRIRNNLMHGIKRIEQLNDQLELFEAVNDVLESIT